MLEVRESVHLHFDGNGDLLLDFLGGASRPLGDDLYVIVGDVGIGFDGQVVKGNGAPHEQKKADG